MLDRWARRWLARPLEQIAAPLARLGIQPEAITLMGLALGLATIPLLQAQHYQAALALILANRFCDGLDGPLARAQAGEQPPQASGAYLDIVCDMLFYGAVVTGMALAQPQHAIWSVWLLFGFLGTSSSFLAYAALSNTQPDDGRGLFFLIGLVEGSETILFFISFCLFPELYPILAMCFAVLCFLTTAIRLAASKKI